MFFRLAIPLAIISLTLPFSPSFVIAGPVQNPSLKLPSDAHIHRQAVQDIFTDSYAAYKKYAFGHDDLRPVNRSFIDGRNGWGASIVDALSTMKIMGLDDIFNEGVEFSSKIDFNVSHTSDTVVVFETTIRYLAGLLSAYELSDQKFPALLQKAKEVADKMAFAWVPGTSPVPFINIDFNTSTAIKMPSMISQAGTLSLEWFTLTKHTGNDTYCRLGAGSAGHIAEQPAPLPGLPAQGIDPSTGNPIGAYVSWGSGSDSYFEYLIKYARLTNTDDPFWADQWALAVDTSIKKLLRTSTVGNHLYLADQDDDGRIRHIGSHLGCFAAGNWLMGSSPYDSPASSAMSTYKLIEYTGGRLLNNQTIVDIGLKLNDACWNTYASTATGIGPEIFAYISPEPNGTFTGAPHPPTPHDLHFYSQHGFYIFPNASYYYLRPEVLESNFYAWRVTGSQKYLDRAVSAIASFRRSLKVGKGGVGYAGIEDVDDGRGTHGGFINDMESFWFAEVLKYLYLTFDDPNHISLDEYVFNTEAHPFKAPPAKASYGSGRIIQPSTAPFKTQSGELPDMSYAPALPQQLKETLGRNNSNT
ncbi:seven-hairpin glycosidase [Panus rudis PR-1116 ss-1]|nr:seven-hairpin glycosidase [Panus rudis PR-1116 ss-1]